MATVIQGNATDVVHGVLHMVSGEEKQSLDKTESSYQELQAHVETRTSVALRVSSRGQLVLYASCNAEGS